VGSPNARATPSALDGTALPSAHLAIAPDNVRQVREIARWGQGQNAQVAYSPNGRYLRVTTAVDEFFYDTRTWAAIPATAAIRAAFVDPDALYWEWEPPESSPVLLIKRVRDGALVNRLVDARFGAGAIFSPDWQWIAIPTGAQWELYAVASGALHATLSLGTETCYGFTTSAAFSTDGRYFVAGSRDIACVFLWQIPNEQPQRVINANRNHLPAVALAPDKATLLSLADDGSVTAWRAQDGAALYTVNANPPFGWVNTSTLALAPNGATFALGLGNGEVLVYALGDGRLLQRLHPPAPTGWALAFSPDDRWLAAEAWGAVRLWSLDTGAATDLAPAAGTSFAQLEGPSGRLSDLAFSPNGQTLVATFDTGEPGNAAAWDVTATTAEPRPFPLEPQWGDIAFSPNGRFFAALTDFNTLALLRPRDWAVLWEQPLKASSSDVAFAADNQSVLTLGLDGLMRRWNVTDAELLMTLPPRRVADYRLFAFAPPTDEMALLDYAAWHVYRASRQFDYVYDLRYWRAEAAQDPPTRPMALAYSPDGQLIATGLSTGEIRLWRTEDGQWLATLLGHRASVVGLAFSRAGQWLASGSADGTVRLWGIRP
jgi:WD40 repeat protein